MLLLLLPLLLPLATRPLQCPVEPHCCCGNLPTMPTRCVLEMHCTCKRVLRTSSGHTNVAVKAPASKQRHDWMGEI
jgi:hypothetical protein